MGGTNGGSGGGSGTKGGSGVTQPLSTNRRTKPRLMMAQVPWQMTDPSYQRNEAPLDDAAGLDSALDGGFSRWRSPIRWRFGIGRWWCTCFRWRWWFTDRWWRVLQTGTQRHQVLQWPKQLVDLMVVSDSNSARNSKACLEKKSFKVLESSPDRLEDAPTPVSGHDLDQPAGGEGDSRVEVLGPVGSSRRRSLRRGSSSRTRRRSGLRRSNRSRSLSRRKRNRLSSTRRSRRQN